MSQSVYFKIVIATLVLCNEGISLPSDSSCIDLNVYTSTRQASPREGTQLPYCRTSDLQCCTTNYLEDLKSEKILNISSGAQADLMNIFKPWHESFIMLTESLNEFITMFSDGFPFPHSIVSAQAYLASKEQVLASQLLPFESVDMNFNFTVFVSNLTFELVEIFVRNANIDDNQRACLGETINDRIMVDAIEKTGEDMKELQLIYQSLQRLKAFLDNLTIGKFGYMPNDQCLDALLSQECEQCKKNIPTLCEDVCTSLVITCLSPLQDGLQSQVEAVWNVSKQMTLLTQQLMEDILRKHQPSILPPTALLTIAQRAYSDCDQLNAWLLFGVEVGKRKREVSTIPLPPSLSLAVQKAQSLKGVLSFTSVSLPSYCSSTSNPRDCWNGEEQVENGAVPANSVLKLNVADQKNSPIYDFSLYQLDQQAVSVKDLTTEFLDDLQLNTLPTSIMVPPVVPYIAQVPPPPTTSSTPTSSHTHTSVAKPTTTPPPTLISPDDRTGSAGRRSSTNSFCLILAMVVLSMMFTNISRGLR